VYLARLRRKLRELDDSTRIKTAHGIGYRLVVDEDG
jgi:DNA-binding response OmpR family regulator